jgi:hypothetical protein
MDDFSRKPSKNESIMKPDNREVEKHTQQPSNLPGIGKSNPFMDPKVKSAFADLDDDKSAVVKKRADEDNGLIVDNDFGDDFDEEEEEESENEAK